MNVDPEIVELRNLVKQTTELVNQNAKDHAHLRGTFGQIDNRINGLVQSVDNHFGQIGERISGVESQLNTQLRWIIGRWCQCIWH
jgi:archaellum component FlaC